VFRNYTGMPLVGAAESKGQATVRRASEARTETVKTIIRHA
jgi:hypothetical protein